MYGKITKYKCISGGVNVLFADRSVNFVFITPKIIEIFEGNKGDFSLSLKKISKRVEAQVNEQNGRVILKNAHLTVEISDYFKTKIFDANSQLLCEDYDRDLETLQSTEDLSVLALEGHRIQHKSFIHTIQVKKKLYEDEKIYGLGEKTGFLNKRNYEYEMWNSDNPDPHVDSFRALYKSIPFYISLRPEICYGIYFDNTHKTFYDIGKTFEDCLSFGSEQGSLDYYFIYGKNMPEVVQNYTILTGKTPLPQKWTLGHHQSRWSYENKEEVVKLAEKFREFKIPCDVIHLDIDYMERFKVFTYDQEKFDQMPRLINDLREKGFKIVTIIDPGIKVEKDYFVYEEAVKNKYIAETPDSKPYINAVWPGDSVFPSFIKKSVRLWWKNNLKVMTDLGVSGIWNDMNEPASFNGPLPLDVVFPGNKKNYLHEEIHNIYGHYMAKATYEGLLDLEEKRPFVITRACFAGSQKYSTVWTGDNHSIWAHLQMSIPMLCNLGLSGMSFVGTDVGGFGSDCTPELMARWVQVGCFSPLFRNHSAKGTRRQEPWAFNAQVTEIYRKYVELRYQLIPYFYDLFYHHLKTGLPILRPLVLHYSDDPETFDLNDQFMVGENLLVAPVVCQGQTKRMIYIPRGKWFDYWTKQPVKSGHQLVEAPLGHCPIYVKNQTLLPKYAIRQSIQEEKNLILEIYGDKGKYIHFQDQGEDLTYLEKKYNLYEFTWQKNILSVKMLHHNYFLYESIKIIYGDQEKVFYPSRGEYETKF